MAISISDQANKWAYQNRIKHNKQAHRHSEHQQEVANKMDLSNLDVFAHQHHIASHMSIFLRRAFRLFCRHCAKYRVSLERASASTCRLDSRRSGARTSNMEHIRISISCAQYIIIARHHRLRAWHHATRTAHATYRGIEYRIKHLEADIRRKDKANNIERQKIEIKMVKKINNQKEEHRKNNEIRQKNEKNQQADIERKKKIRHHQEYHRNIMKSEQHQVERRKSKDRIIEQNNGSSWIIE